MPNFKLDGVWRATPRWDLRNGNMKTSNQKDDRFGVSGRFASRRCIPPVARRYTTQHTPDAAESAASAPPLAPQPHAGTIARKGQIIFRERGGGLAKICPERGLITKFAGCPACGSRISRSKVRTIVSPMPTRMAFRARGGPGDGQGFGVIYPDAIYVLISRRPPPQLVAKNTRGPKIKTFILSTDGKQAGFHRAWEMPGHSQLGRRCFFKTKKKERRKLQESSCRVTKPRQKQNTRCRSRLVAGWQAIFAEARTEGGLFIGDDGQPAQTWCGRWSKRLTIERSVDPWNGTCSFFAQTGRS